jgi:hypothetical protein
LLSSAIKRKSSDTRYETSTVIDPKDKSTKNDIINTSFAPMENKEILSSFRLFFFKFALGFWLLAGTI